MSLKTYQWIKGDKAGQTVKSDGSTMQDGNIEYLVFNDGSRCNATLIGDYILEVASEHPDDLFLFEEKPMAPQPQKVVVAKQEPLPEKITEKKEVITLENPVENLLNSAKKVKQSVPINVTVEVPPTELLKVVSASFENGEKHIEEYLVKNWSQEQVNALQQQIAQHIMSGVFEKPKTKRKNEKV